MKQAGSSSMLMIGIQKVLSSELSWTPATMKSFVVFLKTQKKKSIFVSLK